MTEELATRATRAVAELELAGSFLRGPYFEAVIVRAVAQSVAAANSPWMDRAAAAAHCRCSVSEIDRATKRGVIQRFERGGTPLFQREDLDAAITGGRWQK